VLRLLEVFHNVGVVSLVLRFVHPQHFRVFSTPVHHLVQVNRGATVELYLAYCEELAQWAAHFGIPSVAETEMALWAFVETTKDVGTASPRPGTIPSGRLISKITGKPSPFSGHCGHTDVGLAVFGGRRASD